MWIDCLCLLWPLGLYFRPQQFFVWSYNLHKKILILELLKNTSKKSEYILALVLNIKACNTAITYREWTSIYEKKTYASSLLKWTPDRNLLAWLHFSLNTWSLQRSTSLYLDMEQFSNCQSHRRNHKQRRVKSVHHLDLHMKALSLQQPQFLLQN